MTATQLGAEAIAALRRLDVLLERALLTAEPVEGGRAVEGFRGLYVDRAQVDALLSRPPGEPLLGTPPGGRRWAALARLRERFGLDAFDCDALVLALAPEVDLRYERLVAYLHDDVTRRAPSVDLALNLLCATATEKLERRARFEPGAPLVDHGLLAVDQPDGEGRSLLAAALRADGVVVRHLLGIDGLDPRLAGAARLGRADGAPAQLVRRMRAFARGGDAARAWACGRRGAGRGRVAAALARALRRELLAFDLRRARDPLGGLAVALRQARLRDAVAFVDGLDELADADAGDAERACAALAAHPGPLVVAGAADAPPPGLPGLAPVAADESRRARLAAWRGALGAGDGAPSDDLLARLSERFRLTPADIAAVAAQARAQARWRATDAASRSANGAAPAQPSAAELFAAARARSGGRLSELATRVRPRARWEDLVLPADAELALRQICERVELGPRVLEDWGFAGRLSRGRGVSALFAGASGTGKTMAAEVIAGELGLDLYRVDLSAVVSKYIGETEKNLARVFAAAAGADVVLFFDEADALFGKRSEVRDSHDRYANIEVSHLLQLMEEHEGVAILATNMREQVDDAFLRRLAFAVHFPFPAVESRRRIWAGAFPPEVPVADDLDRDALAASLKLSGGGIRNAALAAAYAAAADGLPVGMAHVREAAAGELRKLGLVETLPPEHLAGVAGA